MKYFKGKEFECKCCGSNDMRIELLMKLDQARELAGIPFVITSGYRCKQHNENIGGSPVSQHLTGKAVDILCKSDRDRWIILTALMEVGFKRIGIAKDFIHVDVKNSAGTIWTY